MAAGDSRAADIRSVLSYRNLTGLIQNPKGGIPTTLPPAFMNTTRRVEGDSATYTRIRGTRKTARMVMYGNPSMRREMQGIEEVPVKLMHEHEHIMHPAHVLVALRNYNDPQMQDRGKEYIAHATADFRQLFLNSRIAAIHSVLGQGAIYYDEEGNLLPDSSGAQVTIDYGVPDGNQGTCDWDGNGAIIGASWATAGTDIIGDIQEFKMASVRLTGYPLEYAFYGANVLGYLMGNTAIQNIYAGDPSLAAAFGRREIPDGFLGLKWRPVHESFFVDQDGNYQSFFRDDYVTFTPAPDRSWWEVLEGSYLVPNDLGSVSALGTDVVNRLSRVHGMFSCAKVMDDPASIKQNFGDTFLPTLKVPGAIFIADTTT